MLSILEKHLFSFLFLQDKDRYADRGQNVTFGDCQFATLSD